jgi:phytoene dehydrogenase-like protein
MRSSQPQADMEHFDFVIVGSGVNSLVCAALLAKKGRRVCVIERADVAGGCIRTEELTRPGFRHDTLSTLYPLFVSAPHFPQLRAELEQRGASFAHSAQPTAVLLPDGRSLVYGTDRAANVAALDAQAPGDGAALQAFLDRIERDSELVGGLLGGEFWRAGTGRLLARRTWRRGMRAAVGDAAATLLTCRAWLERDFRSDLARALFAPWVLHVGQFPEGAGSALMAQLVMFTLEQAGAPVVKGGSRRLVEAFVELIEAHGGCVLTGVEAERIAVAANRALGVRTTDGRELRARRGVVCNVTPTQLYMKLLDGHVPAEMRERVRRYRYGRAGMQIHLALERKPRWTAPDLERVALVHVTGGLDAVSKAVNEAERGLLPAEPTLAVVQPVEIDPSRAPEGSSILWIQLLELPRVVHGDAAGTIPCPADGAWTSEIRERYADRVVQRLCRHIPNLDGAIVGRAVLGPADLERLNVNLAGGDPYAGACSLDQFGPWRPLPGLRDHETPVERLYHIGASTHPGPGLGGMSGFMVASRLG